MDSGMLRPALEHDQGLETPAIAALFRLSPIDPRLGGSFLEEFGPTL